MGKPRYFPLPVPESSPTHPVGIFCRNSDTRGQGYCRSKWLEDVGYSNVRYLVSGGREVRRDVVIHRMYVSFLVCLGIVIDDSCSDLWWHRYVGSFTSEGARTFVKRDDEYSTEGNKVG
jgi:hypothetical protein